MNQEKYQIMFAGKKLVIELGTMANLSNQSVVVRYGNSVVLTTVNFQPIITNHEFFPLTVMFQEKLYSIGKIPGGFLKREGFPGEHATLCARLIDRSIRPLFAKGFFNEVQVVNTVLVLDEDSDIRFAAAFATSLAISLSGLPFNGPSALVIIGKDENGWIVNPTQMQLSNRLLELIVGGTENAINMVEAGCYDVNESDMIAAINLAHQQIKTLINFQKTIISQNNPKKLEFTLILIPELITEFLKNYENEVIEIAKINDKIQRNFQFRTITAQAKNAFLKNDNLRMQYQETDEIINHFINLGMEKILKTAMRHQIIVNKKRIDGRKVDQIRPLNSMIDVFQGLHGSALFSRGETQVLSVLTLGALAEKQIIDDLGQYDYKRFMHHYNFPPFSVGETGRMGKPNRREIGHGALGEKALLQVIPSEAEFPYTIRLVSEVLASNGSTSQAAICASSLALMAGGVPTRAPIAGIAMGLIKESDDYAILTDIQGIEDHLGDMDFKVAGTAAGICALQMDIKITGIDFIILAQALEQAKIARMQVLKNMNAVIQQPRTTLATNAPKIFQAKVPIDKIRDIIGSGGKVINKIISESNNVKIDIEDDGRVLIYHYDQAAIDKAWLMIEGIINPKMLEIGQEFAAKIVKITNFGAFANLQDSYDGLIHISEFAKYFAKKIDNLNNFIKINSILKVRIKAIDEKNGKISLEIVKS